MARVVLFDLDGTLLDTNTASQLLKRELRDGRMTLYDVVVATTRILRHRLGLLQHGSGNEDAVRWYIKRYKGRPAGDFWAWHASWFNEACAGRVRPGALAAIADHKACGDRCVLATAGMDYIAAPAAAAFGLEETFVASRMGAENGLLTGSLEESAIGEKKAARAREWCEREGASLSTAVFYTDSISDLALAELVDAAGGQVRIVNPDPAMRRVARARGWPLLDWGRSAAGRSAGRAVRLLAGTALAAAAALALALAAS